MLEPWSKRAHPPKVQVSRACRGVISPRRYSQTLSFRGVSIAGSGKQSVTKLVPSRWLVPFRGGWRKLTMRRGHMEQPRCGDGGSRHLSASLRSLDESLPAEPSTRIAPPRPELTIILPTRNEVENVAPLLARIGDALQSRSIEVVFVDDSDDGTAEEAERVGRSCGFEVRVIHRPEGQRDGGLSGAVIRGMRVASAPWVCVMDADLQHPPGGCRATRRACRGGGCRFGRGESFPP